MLEYTPVNKGGTMRLGAKESVFRKNDKSVISKTPGMGCVRFSVYLIEYFSIGRKTIRKSDYNQRTPPTSVRSESRICRRTATAWFAIRSD